MAARILLAVIGKVTTIDASPLLAGISVLPHCAYKQIAAYTNWLACPAHENVMLLPSVLEVNQPIILASVPCTSSMAQATSTLLHARGSLYDTFPGVANVPIPHCF